ncbi:DUF3486 family protein [Lysobacter sp. CA199]|uniref:DUF3486 family protein n=1 Tax=Lysobacter sp. CA199 TaxID=3455608 RepID=UPI003F8D8C5A
MPPRSKVDQLPEALRDELKQRLIANGFSNYNELAEWLTDRGYEIGKSAVGVYGQKLERRLRAIKASTDAARMISEAAPDDADDRSNAIISLVQTQIFEGLLAMQDAEDESNPAKRVEILGKAAKNIATLTRASVARHKWANEIRKQLEAALAAMKKEGFDEGTLAEVQGRIRIYLPDNKR